MNASSFRLGNLVWVRRSNSGAVFQTRITSIEENQLVSDAQGQGDEDSAEWIPVQLDYNYFMGLNYLVIEPSIHYSIDLSKGRREKLLEVYKPSNKSDVWFVAITENRKGKEITQVLIRDLKHVHRLQNLFHVLTGSELEDFPKFYIRDETP